LIFIWKKKKNNKILWWGVIWILPNIDSIIVRKLQEKKKHTFDFIMYTNTAIHNRAFKDYEADKMLKFILNKAFSLFKWKLFHKIISDIAVHSRLFNGFRVFSTLKASQHQMLWTLSLNNISFVWLCLQCFN
jgi:hypothetical protein